MDKTKSVKVIIPEGSRLAVMAPPNTGKDTFIRTFSGFVPKILEVSTGKIFRSIPEHSETLSQGQLVRDEITRDIVADYLEREHLPKKHHYIMLNGYPRNARQVMDLKEMFGAENTFLIRLKVGDAEALRRFIGSQGDDERKKRSDSDIEIFNQRLRQYRQVEPKMVENARKFGIHVINLVTDHGAHTKDVAARFARLHIPGHLLNPAALLA